jgi:hypothetical protein
MDLYLSLEILHIVFVSADCICATNIVYDDSYFYDIYSVYNRDLALHMNRIFCYIHQSRLELLLERGPSYILPGYIFFITLRRGLRGTIGPLIKYITAIQRRGLRGTIGSPYMEFEFTFTIIFISEIVQFEFNI